MFGGYGKIAGVQVPNAETKANLQALVGNLLEALGSSGVRVPSATEMRGALNRLAKPPVSESQEVYKPNQLGFSGALYPTREAAAAPYLSESSQRVVAKFFTENLDQIKHDNADFLHNEVYLYLKLITSSLNNDQPVDLKIPTQILSPATSAPNFFETVSVDGGQAKDKLFKQLQAAAMLSKQNADQPADLYLDFVKAIILENSKI